MLDLNFDFQVSRQRFCRIASQQCPLPAGERLERALCSSQNLIWSPLRVTRAVELTQNHRIIKAGQDL